MSMASIFDHTLEPGATEFYLAVPPGAVVRDWYAVEGDEGSRGRVSFGVALEYPGGTPDLVQRKFRVIDLPGEVFPGETFLGKISTDIRVGVLAWRGVVDCGQAG